MKYSILNILTLVISVFFSKIILSQNNTFTNVDTNYLKPKWMTNNLNVTSFRNGDPIYQAKNNTDFLNNFLLENTPEFIVIETEFGSEYFYNWEAVRDMRELAPIGFKIPLPKDFQSYFNPTEITFNSFGYIDIEYQGEFIEKSGNSLFYWTKTSTKDSTYHANAFLYNESQKSIDSYDFPMHRGSGLSVRCIEDLDYSIKFNDYNYENLLPSEYVKTLERLYKTINENVKLKDKDQISFNGQISVLRDGKNESKITSEIILNNNIIQNQDDLKSNLNGILSSAIVPYYHGQIVQSKSLIDLKIEYNEQLSSKLEFYLSKIKKIDTKSKSNLERADSFGFTCTNKDETIIFIENGSVLNIKKTTFVNDFKAKGPMYSTLCFIPGLGLSQITKDNFNSNKRSNFKKFLLSTSISLGAISIGSKIASTIYYKRYKSDLFGNTAAANYKTANTFQKVFLTTGFGYCLLGAIDFTWTFSIGCKNKVTQHRLNNQIKANPSNFILK